MFFVPSRALGLEPQKSRLVPPTASSISRSFPFTLPANGLTLVFTIVRHRFFSPCDARSPTRCAACSERTDTIGRFHFRPRSPQVFP